MAGMGELLAKLDRGLATIPTPVPGVPIGGVGRVPATPEPGVPTPDTPSVDTAPVTSVDTPAADDPSTPAMSPSLRNWLLSNYSGMTVLDDLMYDYYGGDDILSQIQYYDPDARWVETDMPGEGQGRGRRLDFDVTKLPGVGGPGGGQSIFSIGFQPVVGDGEDLLNPEYTYDDPVYGRITPGKNINQGREPWWTVAAPIAITALAPYAAAGLAGAGIGGAAGLTSSVTGSGLAAGAGAAGATPWWARGLSKLPQAARTVAPLLGGGGGGGAPAPAPVVTTASPTYNPGAFNSGGSTAKSASNDSSLVATNFADDPYGMSR